MKNIIFLDIDGVLNNDACFWFEKRGMSKHCVSFFLKALEVIPDCSVVISSSWRSQAGIDGFIKCCNIQKCFHIFKPVMKYVHEDYCTPKLWDKKRGFEVQAWLDKHPEVEKFLCIDDDGDFLESQPLLQTNHHFGFGWEEMELTKLFFGIKERDNAVKNISSGLKYAEKLSKKKQKFLKSLGLT